MPSVSAGDSKATLGNLTGAMIFGQALRESLDARLAILATATNLGGFVVAHWNGLRTAKETAHGGAFADLYYDIGFGQGAWAVFSVTVFAGIAVGIVTRFKSCESRRLAAQLFVSAGIFCGKFYITT